MTVLSSTYLGSTHRPTMAEYRRQGYLANGWNSCRRWNGRSVTLETAGITGPSRVTDSWTPTPTQAAGNCTVGLHVVRYRYMDSRTGYVSNPSEEREVEVTSTNGQLTFAINTAGAANIIRSTDTKVDKILIEMTTVGDSAEWFLAAEVLNSASTGVVSIADANLELEFLPYEGLGHEPPPVCKNIVSHKERLWLFSQVVHDTGTCSVTNGSALVPAGSTDPKWITESLGSASGQSSSQWLFQRDGDAAVYEIDYYDSGSTRLVLKSNYAGVTGSNVGYKIFSRANNIWVSEPGYPESFDPGKPLNGPNGEGAGDLTAGIGYASSMLFYSLQAMFKFTWDQGPHQDGFYTPLSNQHGALNQRVVIECEGRVYAMDRRGFSVWEGVFPKNISRPVEPLLTNVDFDYSERFHACWFPNHRSIRWFVCYSGETYPKHYFQLDVDTGAWSTGEYLQGISESKLVPAPGGKRRVMLGDENGHTWYADDSDMLADGVPSDLSHLTDAGGSTTTVLVIVEDLPVVNAGLAGCYLTRRTAAGAAESRLIQSNTDSLITLASAFSSAPSTGAIFWVGAIPTKLKTRAMGTVKSMDRRRVKRTNMLGLLFNPTVSQRKMQVRVYEDLSSTAKSWASATGRNNLPGAEFPGSNTLYPTSDWLIDLSTAEGFVSLNIGSEFKRFYEIEFEILEPDADFRLLALATDGSSLEETGS